MNGSSEVVSSKSTIFLQEPTDFVINFKISKLYGAKTANEALAVSSGKLEQ